MQHAHPCATQPQTEKRVPGHLHCFPPEGTVSDHRVVLHTDFPDTLVPAPHTVPAPAHTYWALPGGCLPLLKRYCWSSNSFKMPYSACQMGQTVPHWSQ
jgi:hypothetical protein